MKALLGRGGRAERKGGGVASVLQAQSPAYLQSLPPDLADDFPPFRDEFVLDNLLQLGQHVTRNHGLVEADHIPV